MVKVNDGSIQSNDVSQKQYEDAVKRKREKEEKRGSFSCSMKTGERQREIVILVPKFTFSFYGTEGMKTHHFRANYRSIFFFKFIGREGL